MQGRELADCKTRVNVTFIKNALFQLATTVVGEDDTLHAGFVGQDGILCGRDTLEDDGHCDHGKSGQRITRSNEKWRTLGDAAEPGDVLPAESRVDERLYHQCQ